MPPAPPFPDLRSYLDALRARGDLAEIDAEVDPRLELAEIHRRVIAAGGPALLFRRVKGSPFAAVSNLFGTAERVRLAFGPRARDLVAELAAAPHELLPPSPGRLWRKRGLLLGLARTGLRRRSRGPVTEVRDSTPGLSRLPATVSWPGDGGAFLTLPLVYTEHPETGISNLGLYRMQVFGDDALGIHWQIQKGGGFHHAAAEAAGRALPVNVFLGGPPALILAAIAPLPENVPELLLASLVLGRRLDLARNPAGPLPLAAGAEFALVGEVPPGERRPEGPFGDHYGYYSLRHDYPVFRCRAVFRRRDPILPVTVVGKPRQEDFFLGDWLQDLLAPLFPLVMPGVRDLWSYGETGYHSLSAAVVRERYRREAMVSAFRILGEGQLSLTKFLLVTDAPVDLRDFRKVLAHVLARADFRTDLFILGNLSMDTLDYTGPRVNEGSKGVLLGLGAERRVLKEAFDGLPPPEVSAVEVFCPGCLVIQLAPGVDEATAPARLAAHPAFAGWPLLVLSDDAARAARSAMNFLWTTFTRFNPASDLHAARTELFGTHPAFTSPLLIDARLKPGFPDELFADEATSDLVSRRWAEYYPRGQAMGDSGRAHLD